jgi:Protein of unknown function (DUF1194)
LKINKLWWLEGSAVFDWHSLRLRCGIPLRDIHFGDLWPRGFLQPTTNNKQQTNMKTKLLSYLAIGMSAGLLSSQQASAVNVALELSLLVDVSGSVDATEFALQRDGYAAAFNSPAIHGLITTLVGQGNGGLAVNYVQWDNAPTETIPWTLITNAAEAIAFANLISAIPITSGSGTGVARAINFGTNSINTNNFDGLRQVIDVSGDGATNRDLNGNAISSAQGAILTAAARDAALAAGIERINGLPILGEAGLLAFYQNNVQGGTNSFTLPVNSFDDFSPAIQQKLAAEITNTSVPEGGPGVAMSGLVLLGLAGVHRKMVLRRKSC